MCTVHTHMRPTTLEAHRQANIKIVMLKFVIEVWVIEITTTKKVVSFYGEKKLRRPHQNSAHSAEID